MGLPSYSRAIWSPADEAAAVAPADGADLPVPSRGIYVGVGGDLTVDMVTTGATILFKNVPSGTLLPIMVKRVRNTGTTALSIVSIY